MCSWNYNLIKQSYVWLYYRVYIYNFIFYKLRSVASLLFLCVFPPFYCEFQLYHALLSLQTAANFKQSDRHNGCVFHRPNRLQTVINQPVTWISCPHWRQKRHENDEMQPIYGKTRTHYTEKRIDQVVVRASDLHLDNDQFEHRIGLQCLRFFFFKFFSVSPNK